MTDFDTLALSIINGDRDDELDGIIEAIKTRRSIIKRTKGAVAKATLKPGTKVRLTGLRPAYLNGLTGTVTDSRATSRIAVKLDRSLPRFGDVVRCPAHCLEAV